MELALSQPGRLMRLVKQFSKFIIVGGINTGIDFAVLNILFLLTGITSGKEVFFFNTVSFSVAVINSYFMNKYWTFEDRTRDPNKEGIKFSEFLIVSVIGAGINGGILYAFTTLVNPLFGLSPLLWANVGKLLATGVSLIWNFIGYKLWVFKR